MEGARALYTPPLKTPLFSVHLFEQELKSIQYYRFSFYILSALKYHMGLGRFVTVAAVHSLMDYAKLCRHASIKVVVSREPRVINDRKIRTFVQRRPRNYSAIISMIAKEFLNNTSIYGPWLTRTTRTDAYTYRVSFDV